MRGGRREKTGEKKERRKNDVKTKGSEIITNISREGLL